MTQILCFQLGDIHEQTYLLSADTEKTMIVLFIQLVLGYPSRFPTESGRIWKRMNFEMAGHHPMDRGGTDLRFKELLSNSMP